MELGSKSNAPTAQGEKKPKQENEDDAQIVPAAAEPPRRKSDAPEPKAAENMKRENEDDAQIDPAPARPPKRNSDATAAQTAKRQKREDENDAQIVSPAAPPPTKPDENIDTKDLAILLEKAASSDIKVTVWWVDPNVLHLGMKFKDFAAHKFILSRSKLVRRVLAGYQHQRSCVSRVLNRTLDEAGRRQYFDPTTMKIDLVRHAGVLTEIHIQDSGRNEHVLVEALLVYLYGKGLTATIADRLKESFRSIVELQRLAILFDVSGLKDLTLDMLRDLCVKELRRKSAYSDDPQDELNNNSRVADVCYAVRVAWDLVTYYETVESDRCISDEATKAIVLLADFVYVWRRTLTNTQASPLADLVIEVNEFGKRLALLSLDFAQPEINPFPNANAKLGISIRHERGEAMRVRRCAGCASEFDGEKGGKERMWNPMTLTASPSQVWCTGCVEDAEDKQ